MPYEVGQVVCLWQEELRPGKVTVLKEVLVTITGVKTGVPGFFSLKPVSMQSLRGIGDDCKLYEKHWVNWPESQTNDYLGQWSSRDDGEGDDRFWIPKEAVHAYNTLNDLKKRFPDEQIVRLDKSGQPIVPKGDVEYCEKHDDYRHKGSQCFWCILEGRRDSAA